MEQVISTAPGILKSEKLAALKEKLAKYKRHECSFDDHEASCPVCGDIEQIEWEIEMLQNPGSR